LIKKIINIFIAVIITFSITACNTKQPGNSTQIVDDENTSTETIGLSDASAVGVDSDLLENEVKYFEPANPDYKIVASRYGVISDDGLDDSAALQKIIDYMATLPEEATKVIYLPEGDIDIVELSNTANYEHGLDILNISNLSIVGFSQTNPTNIYIWGTVGFKGLYIRYCSNFLLKNVNVDWGKIPYVMGKIEEFNITGKYAIVRIDNEFTVDNSFEVFSYLEYDRFSNQILGDGNLLHNEGTVQIKSNNYLGDNRMKINFNTSIVEAEVGTMVVLCETMRHSDTFYIYNCVNIYFEHVNLYTSPGMGCVVFSTNNFYMNHYRCISKPGTSRLLTTTSDMLHMKNNSGEIIITNSIFEGGYDDAVNVGGMYLRINLINEKDIKCLSPLGFNETYKPNVDDKYEVINTETFETIKTVTVTKVTLCEDGYILNFDEDISNLKVGYYLNNLNHVASFTFKNSVIRNKRNRGILLQTRNVLIENCNFSNVVHCPILFAPGITISHESTIPNDVVIKNCKFYNNSAASYADIIVQTYNSNGEIAQAGTVKNLVIKNNLFAYSGNSALALGGVLNAEITHNYFYSPATAGNMGSYNCCLALEQVKNITIKYNEVFNPNSLSYKPIIAKGGVDINSTVISSNINLSINDLIGETASYKVSKLQNTINLNDNSLEDWANQGTEINIAGCTADDTTEIDYTIINSDDFSVVVKVIYDDTGIYFSYNVTDNDVKFNFSDWWLGDGCEIFLTDCTTELIDFSALKLMGYDCLQYHIKPENSGGNTIYKQRTSSYILENNSSIIANSWVTSNGYAAEGYIPFNVVPKIKNAVENGNEISLTFTFGDSDPNTANKVFRAFSTVAHSTFDNKYLPAKMTKFLLN
jgi:hypothetical protein